jgi:hypothetical protein
MKLPRLFVGFVVPVFALFAATQCLAANPVNFAKAVAFNSGALGANSIVLADVNGDGIPDMIVATNSGVSVFINTGSPGAPSFNPSTTYSTDGQASQAVAVADINNDGILDIVVANMCAQGQILCYGVAVLLGNGDGTFQSAVGFNVGGYETGAVAIADLNGDGNLDLVMTNNCQQYTCAGGSLTWLPGNGDGTFQEYIQLDATKGGPVAIADVNNDGCPDLITGGGVLLNTLSGSQCTGNFTLGTNNIPGGTVSIALADVNGDGKLDVIVIDASGVGVQLGNGDGTFQNAVNYKTGGHFPLSVAVADVNGDGNLDLAVANECTTLSDNTCTGAGSVGVLAGKGDGTFKTVVTFNSIGEFATSVALADIDGDGKLDVALTDACTSSTNCSTGDVSIFLNNFMAVTTTKVTSSVSPAVIDQSVTFTATVGSSTSLPPKGSPVSFTAGANVIGTSLTDGNGVASVTTSFAAAGSYKVQASYGGDLFHNPSTGSYTEDIDAASSTTTLTSGLNPSDYGQSVTLTAVVAGSVGIPTGNVTFYTGTTSLGTAALNNTGTAALNTTKLAAGSDSVTAKYAGDSQNAKSTSNVVTQTVNPAQVALTLTSSLNPSTVGKSVRFTVTLTSDGALPTGSVTLSSNGTTIGTANIVAGKASLATSTLPQGSDTITATYPGSAQFSAASGSLIQQVN